MDLKKLLNFFPLTVFVELLILILLSLRIKYMVLNGHPDLVIYVALLLLLCTVVIMDNFFMTSLREKIQRLNGDKVVLVPLLLYLSLLIRLRLESLRLKVYRLKELIQKT